MPVANSVLPVSFVWHKRDSSFVFPLTLSSTSLMPILYLSHIPCNFPYKLFEKSKWNQRLIKLQVHTLLHSDSLSDKYCKALNLRFYSTFHLRIPKHQPWINFSSHHPYQAYFSGSCTQEMCYSYWIDGETEVQNCVLPKVTQEISDKTVNRTQLFVLLFSSKYIPK